MKNTSQISAILLQTGQMTISPFSSEKRSVAGISALQYGHWYSVPHSRLRRSNLKISLIILPSQLQSGHPKVPSPLSIQSVRDI